MNADKLETFYPTERKGWRNWLAENHQLKHHIWLVMDKSSSQNPNLSWGDAVEEALCFGWIDSKKLTLDDQRYMQYYTKRKPNSIWSKVNKKKVAELIKNNLMTEAGYETISTAKKNGSWTKHDRVEALEVPSDLQEVLNLNSTCSEFYDALSDSRKKGLLFWITSAVRQETKEKRIAAFIENAKLGQLPKPLQ